MHPVIQHIGDHLAALHAAPARGGLKSPPSAPPAIPPIVINPLVTPSSILPPDPEMPVPAIDPRRMPERPPLRPPGHPDWRFPRIV